MWHLLEGALSIGSNLVRFLSLEFILSHEIGLLRLVTFSAMNTIDKYVRSCNGLYPIGNSERSGTSYASSICAYTTRPLFQDRERFVARILMYYRYVSYKSKDGTNFVPSP